VELMTITVLEVIALVVDIGGIVDNYRLKRV
jgi:hypothetical protein